ncbi:hypothetical protein RQM47_01005 [Rubrivirga sp. S365]|uniref:Uncharacterized protein n=1 Tax=Rubrivirga litoralis TaxID=3075598 RepID=A0ABU3BSZ2_9BACT|nr:MULTISPECIES: hypothetical protein [unclassified Rubrivirga]MDT0632416.1 hypothetical protein [Rubrivirga sp. F394]MDT7855213.1 hypothetical protein [Rubrivirga sp. S365]
MRHPAHTTGGAAVVAALHATPSGRGVRAGRPDGWGGAVQDRPARIVHHP